MITITITAMLNTIANADSPTFVLVFATAFAGVCAGLTYLTSLKEK